MSARSNKNTANKRTSWYLTSSERLFAEKTERRASILKKIADKKLKDSPFDPSTSNPTEVWSYINVCVLPLFNGEGVQEPIEYLNELVVQQLESRDVPQVLGDLKELLRMGMTIMQEKLPTIPDELLAVRLVELWTFFFGNVLPYLEGVFEPIGTEAEKRSKIEIGDSSPSSFIRDLSLIACREFILKATLNRIDTVLKTSFSDINSDKRAIDVVWKLIQMFSLLHIKRDEASKKIDSLLSELKYYATNNNQGLRRVDSMMILS